MPALYNSFSFLTIPSFKIISCFPYFSPSGTLYVPVGSTWKTRHSAPLLGAGCLRLQCTTISSAVAGIDRGLPSMPLGQVFGVALHRAPAQSSKVCRNFCPGTKRSCSPLDSSLAGHLSDPLQPPNAAAVSVNRRAA